MDASLIHSNNRLRQERVRCGWRQQDLADQLGTTVITVKRWERGSQQPSAYFLVKLCTLFCKNAQELGFVSESPQSSNEGGDESTVPDEYSTSSFSPSSSYIWGVPFRRNPFFTGRSLVLEHLHIMLTPRSTIPSLTQSYALYGLGGIGKTQLAIEYAYQYRSEYDAILWIKAETQMTLISSFVTLAALFALPEKIEEDQSKIVAAVLHWFNRHERWLLILDNVEDLSLIKSFLPENDQGAPLFTTRLQSMGMLAKRVELSPMTLQEGCDFLLARTNRLHQHREHALMTLQEVTIAQQIVFEMGGLPLALEQAGAYIDDNRCSLSDYLQIFHSVQDRLLSEHESTSDHPLSVSQTFMLAFERVKQCNPLAAEILIVCAFLAPEDIPETFFLKGASLLGPIFGELASDPLVFSEAIKVLLSHSLLQRCADTRTITIHCLVQTVLRGHLSKDTQRTWRRRVIEVTGRFFPSRPSAT